MTCAIIFSTIKYFAVINIHFKRLSFYTQKHNKLHLTKTVAHYNVPSLCNVYLKPIFYELLIKHFDPLLISCRCNSYWRYKYTTKLEMVVNRQIQEEQQAAQNYLSMAVYFLNPCVGRPGTGGFFMLMYEEEVGHMKDFIQYQLTRGGNVQISSLNAPPTFGTLSLLEAFTKSLSMEKHVTQLLEEIVSVAEVEKDYQCADFVTSLLLAEQMKSINEISHHISKLTRLEKDEHALYNYDLQLSSSHPYRYKRRVSPI